MNNTPTRLEVIAQDLVSLAVIGTIAAIVGLFINQARKPSLPLVYKSKTDRIDQAVVRLSETPVVQSNTEVILDENVSLDEIKGHSELGDVLIFDARPEIFHRLGRIPNAISFPREDFENAYFTHREQLETNKSQPIILYCSNSSCEDSALVFKGLQSLGYTNIGIFRGGWSEWQRAGLPVLTNE